MFYVYYIDRGKELLYTSFTTIEMATTAAKILGGHIKQLV